MFTPSKLLEAWERGLYTRVGVIGRLIDMACDYPPEQIAEQIGPEWLPALADKTANPPNTPSAIFIIQSVCRAPGITLDQAEAEEREEKRRYFDGLWRWHHYFAGRPK